MRYALANYAAANGMAIPANALDHFGDWLREKVLQLWAITQALCTSFKTELLTGTHDFTATTGNVFKIALYTSAATLGPTTTAYSAANEVVGAGYTAGGNTLVNVTPVASGTTAFLDFNDSVWSAATITARGALIYNFTKANRAVGVLDFGSDQSATAGTFTIVFPNPDPTNAIIRIS
jgi:hypothetical protein